MWESDNSRSFFVIKINNNSYYIKINIIIWSSVNKKTDFTGVVLPYPSDFSFNPEGIFMLKIREANNPS